MQTSGVGEASRRHTIGLPKERQSTGSTTSRNSEASRARHAMSNIETGNAHRALLIVLIIAGDSESATSYSLMDREAF